LNGTGKWTAVPLATTSAPGLLTQVSGITTDYVGGDNACHPLPTTASGLLPSGSVIDYAGSVAPAGWLLCDGSSYSTTGPYAALFAIIQYAFGGSGGTFNVPDLRGRVSVGAGHSPTLANRVLGATGGEETHFLLATELASHTHGVAHTHTMGNHTHLGVDHLHSMQNHTHLGVNHLHAMDHYHNWGAQGSHAHSISDGGHSHNYTQYPQGGPQATSGVGAWAVPTGTTATTSANLQAASNLSIVAAATPAGNTVYASQTSAGWANTGACDRDLTTGGPSVATTGAADRGLTTGGPSTNTTDGASIANTGATGSGVDHNNMQPFAVVNKIIKT
jgi:microcystin-dependent protein